MSSQRDRLDRLRTIVDEIGLTPENIMEFEECEIVSDLMEEGAVLSLEDEELRGTILEMRRLHEGIRKSNHAEYQRLAEELFSKLGRREWALKYHEAEGLARSLSEGEVARLGDEGLRRAYAALRHVHDGVAQKKAAVIARMSLV